MKRFLEMSGSDFWNIRPRELLGAIAASEGRVLACETIGTVQPVLGDVTNAEFAAAMGADILLLNMFDVQNPEIRGLPDTEPEEKIRLLRRLTGRPIGINLEPVEKAQAAEDTKKNMWAMTPGRRATLENARKAVHMGVNLIMLTGNPGMGVTNAAIEQTLQVYRKELGTKVILGAGKMHASGILSEAGENIITKKDVKAFRQAGADLILFPAPGTVPGITTEYIRELVAYAHSLGALAMTAVGTSQEGADQDTIRRIALMCKMTGADIHHLGDSGFAGMSLPENIMAYSMAIRGVRHTYHRMASSVNR